MIRITIYFEDGEFTKINYEGTYEQASRVYLGSMVYFEGKNLKVVGIDID